MKAVCIASGSSLTLEDVEYCKGKAKIYVVKECYKLAPWADVLYAADSDWWDYMGGCPDFSGEKWTCTPEAPKKYPDLNYIEYQVNIPWSNMQGIVATGGNSGFQALNLACLQGASEVILIGYDMGFSGRKHWYDGIYSRESRPSNYNDWIKRFNLAAPHIKIPVYNATRGGYLECFPRVKLEDVL